LALQLANFGNGKIAIFKEKIAILGQVLSEWPLGFHVHIFPFMGTSCTFFNLFYPFTFFTLLPFYPLSLLPFYPFTLQAFYPFTVLPVYAFTLLPFYPSKLFTLLPLYPFTPLPF